MARSFPSDVLVLDSDSLVHARFGRGKGNPRLVQAKSYRLAADTFTNAVVTPELTNEAALAEAVRRLKGETGKWDKASLLLPDSWFRINIVDLPSLPDKPAEAMEVVRWSLKRTLPIPPSELRVAYDVISRSGGGAKVMIVSALAKTLVSLEKTFAAAGIDLILIEPVGLNIWNAITVREAETAAQRLFVYVREQDFTTAAFAGAQPLFIRSRNLSGDRTLQQEIRLSASYLRETLSGEFAHCYIAGNGVDREVHETLASEFNTQVRAVALRDFVDGAPDGLSGYDAELTACTGVFTA
jgi:type IV pilus assembly protein PilM